MSDYSNCTIVGVAEDLAEGIVVRPWQCKITSRNLCSNGDLLSLRQIREKDTRTFRSAMGNNATPLGQCHLAESLTKATPSLQDTKLRIVAWLG
jgi:hypothetical protein